MRTIPMFLIFAATLLPALDAYSQGAANAPAGNAERGRTYYVSTFKCASCHGTRGLEGSPRLVPMTRDQSNFISFVQKPSVNAMPSYGDQPAQALADVYAYIKSIPAPALPPVTSIPALNEALKTVQ